MPVYRFRLEDSATGEFRSVSVAAESPAEAEEIVLKQERKKVSFEISPEEAAGLEKRLKEGTLTGRDKARLLTHQQTSEYKIMKAKES